MNEVMVTHIEAGDTLSEIAARHGVSVDALQRWNGIENPDLVLVGQQIVVYRTDSYGTFAFDSARSNTEPGLDVPGLSGMGSVVALAVLLIWFWRKLRAVNRFSRTSKAHYPKFRRAKRRSDPIKSRTGTLVGKAYVTDGDGIRVAGQEVRLAGLDAPEWDQVAKHKDGYWFGHGRRVKSALIQEIGGKQVQVIVKGSDKFGRSIGTVIYNGKDVGEWLVREGHAIAAYTDEYERVEGEARKAKRGMWGHAVNIDPRRWRHRNSS